MVLADGTTRRSPRYDPLLVAIRLGRLSLDRLDRPACSFKSSLCLKLDRGSSCGVVVSEVVVAGVGAGVTGATGAAGAAGAKGATGAKAFVVVPSSVETSSNLNMTHSWQASRPGNLDLPTHFDLKRPPPGSSGASKRGHNREVGGGTGPRLTCRHCTALSRAPVHSTCGTLINRSEA